MLCPICGKETEKGLCRDCFLKRNPIKLKDIKLVICSSCGQFLYKGSWRRNIDRFLDGIIEDNLVHHSDIRIRNLDFGWEEKKNRIGLDIKITAEYKGGKFKTSLNSAIKIEKKLCLGCSRRSGGYYEAILQFRIKETPTEKDVHPEYVSKVEKVRGGFDFYITSLRYARQTASHYRDRGYKTKESPKQAGVRNGKKFYRFSISIKEG